MEQSAPLPLGTVIHRYTLRLVKQSGPLGHVYYATDERQNWFVIREFCPQGLAVRDPITGKIHYPQDLDVETHLMPLKTDFERQFGIGVIKTLSECGTFFFVYTLPAELIPAVSQTLQEAAQQRTPATLPVLQTKTIEHTQTAEPTRAVAAISSAQGPPAKPPVRTPQFIQRIAKSKFSLWVSALLILGTGLLLFLFTDNSESAAAQEVPHQEKTVKKSAKKSKGKQHQAHGGEVKNTPPAHTSASPAPKIVTPAEPVSEAPVSVTPINELSVSPARGKEGKQTTNQAAVQQYIRQFAKPMPLKQWKQQYAQLYTGWFGKGADVAEGWITTFGPLGFRARGLDTSWQEPNFKAAFPPSLLDPNGEPVANVYVVTQVIDGSPASGYVQPGDLLVGIDGQYFKTAQSLNVLYGPYQHQNRRGLDMHAGLLVDKAEGAGKITLNIIPAADVDKITDLAPVWRNILRIEKAKGELPLNVPVQGPCQIKLFVDNGGNNIHSDGFEWQNLRLENKQGKTHPLTQAVNHSVGYGAANYNAADKTWQAHAESVLTFDVPAGDWVLKGKGLPRASASVGVTVFEGGIGSVPPSVLRHVKDVTFDIPQLGSYAHGFPHNCAKSKAVVRMMSKWLAAQQRNDGSWERPGGYCGNHFDTAWAGLALMATGDPEFDPVIKKAAHYIAFSGSQCWWAVPQATAGIFLCEYWLRYKDNSVLPAIRNGVQRMKNEDLYGDYVTGHGIHPGYRGTGVSIGGSHMCLFLALASKTPAKADDDVLEKMMDHAQSICPTGMGPYGRTTETFTFEPNRECGGTYSGRHGPYYMASLLTGGPKKYTQNSKIMYTEGPIGGSDQGHSSETLSIMWALPAYWRSSPQAYYKNMEAFRWKLTLLRPFDGGMMQNPNRLELMTSDPVIGPYIRTAVWITALCVENQNLAITGKPDLQADSFREIPLVIDTESRLLNTYIRNWSLANAALGSKAPEILKKAIKELKAIPVEQGCRFALAKLVNKQALPVAKSIMKVQGVPQLTKATCAEMILGMDVRIFIEQKRENDRDVPGAYVLTTEVRQPLGGRAIGLRRDKAAADKINAEYRYDFAGSVHFKSPARFNQVPDVTWTPQSPFKNDWNIWTDKKELVGPEQSGMHDMHAKIKWQVDDLAVEYVRPLKIGAFEVGCAEKERAVTNCNTLWVPGTLLRDHGNWGCSFTLPDGTYVAAASQGNQILVRDETGKDKNKTWVTPNDACLPQGSKCMFKVAQDWHGLECRVPELRLLKNTPHDEVEHYTVRLQDSVDKIDTANLLDRNVMTVEEIRANASKNDPTVLELTLPKATALRAVDLKLDQGFNRIIIEARKNNSWQPVHWGSLRSSTDRISDAQKAMYANEPEVLRMLQLPGNGWIKCMRTFEPVVTDKLRIKLFPQGDKIRLAELHVYKAVTKRTKA